MNPVENNDNPGKNEDLAKRVRRSIEAASSQIARRTSQLRDQLPTLKWEPGEKLPVLQ